MDKMFQVENEIVDCLCANMYLHHIDNPEIAINEIYRVLKPGGTIYISDFVEHSNSALKKRMHDIWSGFKVNEIEIWFIKKGFKNIKFDILEQGNIKFSDLKEPML